MKAKEKTYQNIRQYQHHLGIINRVIDYLCHHLGEDLSLSKIAELVAMSPFHFHRLFASICGETLHEFVNRKRLEKSAESILMGRVKSFQDLGYKYGFESPSAFSRSFKNHYGMSPSEFRRQRKGTFNKVAKRKTDSGADTISIEQYLTKVSQAKEWMLNNADIEVKSNVEIHLLAIRNQGAFEEVYGAFWRLKQWAENRGLPLSHSKWLMLIHDNPAITEEQRMMQSACFTLDKVVKTDGEVIPMSIPSGKFLVGNFQLSQDADFKKAWDGMSIWLLENQYEPRDGHYFELFNTNSLFYPEMKHEVAIHIPIAH